MNLSIRPLKVGAIESFEKSKFTYLHNFGEKITAPCIVWLIEGTGKKILVDTGPPDPEWSKKYHVKLEWSEEDALDRRLAAVGVDPGDVELVILTHLHWDHCYNLELFPNATFLVQKKELEYAISPLPIHGHAYEVNIPGVTPPWLKVFDRIKVIDGDFSIERGLDVVWLPGHTPGLQGVMVDTRSGVYLIASDFLPLFENWYGPNGPIPPGIHVDLQVCYQTFDKVEGITDLILPGHDPQVFNQQVYE